jgi:hypothetical protein
VAVVRVPHQGQLLAEGVLLVVGLAAVICPLGVVLISQGLRGVM